MEQPAPDPPPPAAEDERPDPPPAEEEEQPDSPPAAAVEEPDHLEEAEAAGDDAVNAHLKVDVESEEAPASPKPGSKKKKKDGAAAKGKAKSPPKSPRRQRAEEEDARPPAASSFPADYDWDAHEDVHRLAEENAELRASLKRSHEEADKLEDALVTLQEELAAAEDTAGGDTPQKVAKDLAKKNRNLSAALNRERARAAHLQTQVERSQADIAALQAPRGGSLAQQFGKGHVKLESTQPGGSGNEGGTEEGGDAAAAREEAKQLKTQLFKLRTRFSEAKVEAAAARAEVTRYQRVLQKEIGEEVPLDRVLDESGKWRGRAQEIALLRDRVADLLRGGGGGGGGGAEQHDASPATASGGKAATARERHLRALAERRQRKQEEDERRAAEAEATALDNERLRQKCQKQSVRLSMLDKTVKESRGQLRLLLNKSDNDDRLIDSLRADLAKARAAASAGPAEGTAKAPARPLAERSEPSRSAAAAGAPAAAAGAAAARPSSASERLRAELARVRGELQEARRINLGALNAVSETWDRTERDSRIELLFEESEGRRRLLDRAEAEAGRLRERAAGLAARVAELESKNKALEIRAASRGSGLGGSRSSSTSDFGGLEAANKTPSVSGMSRLQAKLSVLREKLQAAEREKEFLGQQFREAVAERDERVRAMDEEVTHLRGVHQKAVNGLRQQFLQVQARVEGRQPLSPGSLARAASPHRQVPGARSGSAGSNRSGGRSPRASPAASPRSKKGKGPAAKQRRARRAGGGNKAGLPSIGAR